MLAVATVLCLYISLKYRDWLYPLVFVWAFTGIFIKESQSAIIMTVSIGIGLQLLVAAYTAYQSSKRTIA